jgi:hypothetical protein
VQALKIDAIGRELRFRSKRPTAVKRSKNSSSAAPAGSWTLVTGGAVRQHTWRFRHGARGSFAWRDQRSDPLVAELEGIGRGHRLLGPEPLHGSTLHFVQYGHRRRDGRPDPAPFADARGPLRPPLSHSCRHIIRHPREPPGSGVPRRVVRRVPRQDRAGHGRRRQHDRHGALGIEAGQAG